MFKFKYYTLPFFFLINQCFHVNVKRLCNNSGLLKLYLDVIYKIIEPKILMIGKIIFLRIGTNLGHKYIINHLHPYFRQKYILNR